jgi:hypothetical protein
VCFSFLSIFSDELTDVPFTIDLAKFLEDDDNSNNKRNDDKSIQTTVLNKQKQEKKKNEKKTNLVDTNRLKASNATTTTTINNNENENQQQQWMNEIQEKINEFIAQTNNTELCLPLQLTSMQRRYVHELAEELQLLHVSKDLPNGQRMIVVSKKNSNNGLFDCFIYFVIFL